MVDLRNNVGKYLSAATRHMVAYMARRMEPLGIGAGQYSYLFCLYREDGQSQQQLADYLLVDKSAAVGAINRLEALGYVERQSDPTDRRHYRIHLTERGRAIKPQLEEIVGEVQDLLMDGLSQSERETMLGLLERMVSNITRRI
ncbi:MAG TPA: MarR family transcriptional regulator [Symbiobacteriaceae bacterium]|nr:MarR family transcriptional regulator [Symbiobacteriaceae bacterium]